VHHPNPNEVSALAKIIEKYQVTLLLGHHIRGEHRACERSMRLDLASPVV